MFAKGLRREASVRTAKPNEYELDLTFD